MYLFSEKWHSHGNNKVWPVWFPHWHCSQGWTQAGEKTSNANCHVTELILRAKQYCNLLFGLILNCFYFVTFRMILQEIPPRCQIKYSIFYNLPTSNLSNNNNSSNNNNNSSSSNKFNKQPHNNLCNSNSKSRHKYHNNPKELKYSYLVH